MKVSLERQGKNIVEISVEVPAEKAQKSYDTTCRELAHKVNIPGFRRGKAPKSIIEKTLSPEYIKQETLEHLVPRLLQEAIADEKLDVITEPEINTVDFELGNALTFKAKFEVRPEVSLGEYKGLSVTVEAAKLEAGALDKVLNQIAESKSTLVEIPAHKIKMGDVAVLDFDCYYDGKAVEGGHADGLILEMKPGNFFDGFCEQLIGLEPGDKKDVNVRFPETYRNKELAGKDSIFKVEIKGLRERKMPELNDEFAKSVGAESLEAMKATIKERLEAEIKEENDGRAQKLVIEKVVAQAQVDIPETMIERETSLILEQTKQSYERQGKDWEAFESSEEFAKLKEEKQNEARERILTSLVLGQIIKDEKISVSAEELVPHLNAIASNYNVPAKKIYGNMQLRQKVAEDILAQKVVELLISHAKTEFVPEKEAVGAKK